MAYQGDRTGRWKEVFKFLGSWLYRTLEDGNFLPPACPELVEWASLEKME